MRLVLLATATFLPACTGLFGGPEPVTPQRPTLSADTATASEGTLEFEAGVTVDPGDTLDTPMMLKFGAGPRTELFAGWSPYQTAARPGSDAAGIGDSLVGVRHRFNEESAGAPSTALQFTTRLPSGDQAAGLSTGEIDFFVAGILTRALGDYTTTLFYEAGLLGEPGTDSTGFQHTLALAAGRPVSDRAGVFGELAAVLHPEKDRESYVAMVGATFALSQRFVLDGGVALGLSRDAPDFQVFLGFTTNLGHPRAAPAPDR